MTEENHRRRATARQVWLSQLTPEQRGEYELAHPGEVIPASDELVELGEALQRSIERRGG